MPRKLAAEHQKQLPAAAKIAENRDGRLITAQAAAGRSGALPGHAVGGRPGNRKHVMAKRKARQVAAPAPQQMETSAADIKLPAELAQQYKEATRSYRRIPRLTWPTREALEEVVLLAWQIADHIRRYWGLDGQPTPEPKLALVGDVDTCRRAATVLLAVREQRQGSCPGPVFEWILWSLADEWVLRDPGGLAFFPNPYVVWIRRPPRQVFDLVVLPPIWDEWPPHVPAAYRDLIAAAHPIVAEICGPRDAPPTFTSTGLEALERAAERLRDAIAFVPTDLQRLILETLAGRGLSAEKLMAELNVGSKETLFGKRGRGGLTELVRLGLVQNKRGVGYYRPDAPPAR